MGGNIGTPVLNLSIKKNSTIVIEASSFHLSYSKFIVPDYALLLNISNDHLDWHGSLRDYIKSKFNLFKLQKKIITHWLTMLLKKILEKKSLEEN